jgi:hypothetical protein
MKHIKRVVACMFAGLCLTASADVYHWTGNARDGVWANAANWQEGEIPGLWTNRTEQTFGGKLDDTVIFGAQAEGAPTVIDLQGQYAIDRLIVTNGAPAYTFGTSDAADQRLGFQTNSSIVVAADVTADQTFRRPAVWNTPLGSSRAGTLYFYNDSPSAKLVYGKLDKTTSKTGAPYAVVRLYGAGTIEITDNPQFDQVGTLYFNGTGLVIYGNTSYGGSRYACAAFQDIGGETHEIEVPAGAFLGSMGGSWAWSDHIQFQENTHVYGDGFVDIVTPYNVPLEDPNAPPRLRVWSGKKAVIDVGLGSKNSAKDTVTHTDGMRSELWLNGTNSLPGRLRLMGTGCTMARLVGNKNCTAEQTSIGRGDAVVYEPDWSGSTTKIDNKLHINTISTNGAPQAKFYYSGAGETTDKDLVVSNTYTSAGNVTLGNRGTGTLTWNGNALQIEHSPGTTFTLDAKTAPIVFGGLFAAGYDWVLAVAGSNTVSFGQAQPNVSGSVALSGGVLELTSPAQLPNVSGFVFAGGTLRLTAGGAASVAATFQSGANAIELYDGVELTLSSLSLPSGATLNFVVPEGGSASVTVSGASAGVLPASITWNGVRAEIDANGRVMPHRSAWLSAQNGTWNTVAKWDNGVPETDATALVTASGASYTVTIDEAPAHAIGDLRIANAGAGTATVSVTTTLGMDGAKVDLQPGGALEAGNGGTLHITNTVISFNGGSINGSGSGRVNVKNKFAFGSGTNTFSGTSCLVLDYPNKSKFLYQNPTSDDPSVVTLSERATYYVRQGFWHVCCDVPGGRAILNFDGTDGTQFKNADADASFYGMAVGCRQGYGELNLKHGSLATGNYGIFVATESADSSAPLSGVTTPHCVTGVVNQTGGDLTISAWGIGYFEMICGLVVGDGARMNLTDPGMMAKSVCVGHYNLSGGKLTVYKGANVVGAGIGTGFFNHSGGEYVHNSYGTYSSIKYEQPLVIGLGLRGHGTWTMTGGTTDIRNRVYVGGATKTDLGHVNVPRAEYYPDGDGCTGILDVSNGTFVTTTNLYVGVKGTGTLVLRPTGTIQAANVVLSNGVASVLNPVFEGAATGLLKATGDLIITDGARIEIDATRMSENMPLYTKLASAANVVGEFADGHVSFIYDNANPAMRVLFSEAEIAYELNGEKGLWLKTTPHGTMIIFR